MGPFHNPHMLNNTHCLNRFISQHNAIIQYHFHPGTSSKHDHFIPGELYNLHHKTLQISRLSGWGSRLIPFQVDCAKDGSRLDCRTSSRGIRSGKISRLNQVGQSTVTPSVDCSFRISRLILHPNIPVGALTWGESTVDSLSRLNSLTVD